MFTCVSKTVHMHIIIIPITQYRHFNVITMKRIIQMVIYIYIYIYIFKNRLFSWPEILSILICSVVDRPPSRNGCVYAPTPINVLFKPLQYKLSFWMFIRGISHGFNETQD